MELTKPAKSRYEAPPALLGAIAFLAAGLYWLSRTGYLKPPIYGGVVRDQFGDFAAVPAMTILILVASDAIVWWWSRARHTEITIPRKVRLLTPIVAWAICSLDELGQAAGIYFPHGGSVFDWRDMLAIGLGGAISVLCVARTYRMRPQLGAQRRAAQVLRVSAVVAVALVTMAAGGQSSSGKSKSSSEPRITADAWVADDGDVMLSFRVDRGTPDIHAIGIDWASGHNDEGDPIWKPVTIRVVKGDTEEAPDGTEQGEWNVIFDPTDYRQPGTQAGAFKYSAVFRVEGKADAVTDQGSFGVRGGAVVGFSSSLEEEPGGEPEGGE